MKEASSSLYENSTVSAIVPSSVNSSFFETASTTFSPSLPSTPYINNVIKNTQTGIRYRNSSDELSINNPGKEYASSIYSDESTHLPDDEENRMDEEETILPPTISESTVTNEKENNPEKEKKNK